MSRRFAVMVGEFAEPIDVRGAGPLPDTVDFMASSGTSGPRRRTGSTLTSRGGRPAARLGIKVVDIEYERTITITNRGNG